MGALVLVDGAQAVPHLPVDVQALGCDFYAFSGHKVYGPTGIGVLWGRAELLEAMPPWQGGGDMIRSVTLREDDLRAAAAPLRGGHAGHRRGDRARRGARLPDRRSGSPPWRACEGELLAYATERLAEIPGLRLIGTAREKAAVLSFALEGVHPHDVGTILDREGIAIRTGHHCAQPVMERFGVPATARASFALYNTREEVDALVAALRQARELFAMSPICATSTRRSSSTTTGGRATSGRCRPPTARPRAQPALRRPGDRLPRRRGRPHPGRRLRGRGLRHLDGLRVADDRGPQGADRRGGPSRSSTASTSCSPPGPARADAELGKLAVFSGVREFPMRVKCATLAWHTLKAALDAKDQPVSTE